MSPAGGGLTTSNTRNSRNAKASRNGSAPTKKSTSRNAAISSQTIAVWSATPRSRPVRSAAQTPIANEATTMSMNPRSPVKARNNAATGSATSVPTVPGAIGDRPAPNPKAMKCAGCENRNLSDGAFRIGSAAEMIECRRQGLQRPAVFVPHDESCALFDAADAREREVELLRQRADVCCRSRRRSEAQLIVVAARQQAIERQAAFVAGETAIQRRRTRQRRELEACTHARGIEDVAEIAYKAVGNIDRRGRDAAQPLSKLDARCGPQQRRFALGELIGGKDYALPMMRESERSIAQGAGDEDRVTRVGAAPAQRLSRRRFAQDRHAEIERTPGRVAADQFYTVRIGQREEAARERANPRRIGVRQRTRKQRPARVRAHGRHVGQVHCKRLVPECRGVDDRKKMRSRDQHVHRYGQLAARRRREQRRVVACA